MPLDMLTTPSGKKALLHPCKTKEEVLELQRRDPLVQEYHDERDLEEVAEILNLSTLESKEHSAWRDFSKYL